MEVDKMIEEVKEINVEIYFLEKDRTKARNLIRYYEDMLDNVEIEIRIRNRMIDKIVEKIAKKINIDRNSAWDMCFKNN